MVIKNSNKKKQPLHSFQITLIGIGPKGYPGMEASTQSIVAQAGEIWGPREIIEALPLPADKHPLIMEKLRKRLTSLAESEKSESIHILVYGDPGLNGITQWLHTCCSSSQLKIYPHMDPLQEAFALLTRSWQKTSVFNTALYSPPKIFEKIHHYSPSAVYTSPEFPAPRFLKGIKQEKLSPRIQTSILWPEKGLWRHLLALTPKDLSMKQALPDFGLFLFTRERETTLFKAEEIYSPAEIVDEKLETHEAISSDKTLRSTMFLKISPYPHEIIWDIGAGEGAFAIACAKGIEDQGGNGIIQAVEWETPYFNCFLKNLVHHQTRQLKLFRGRLEDLFSQLSKPDVVVLQERTENITTLLPKILETFPGKIRFLIKSRSYSETTRITQILEALGFDAEVSTVKQPVEKDQFFEASDSFLCLISGKAKT